MNVLRGILAIPRRVIGWIISFGSGGCNLPLPCSQTVNSSNTALSITNTGNGRAGYFRVNNTNNSLFALRAETNGSDAAFGAFTTGSRQAGYFRIDNSSNNNNALHARTNGNGVALYGGRAYGNGRSPPRRAHVPSIPKNRPKSGSATMALGSYNRNELV
jgi:hypothetical protein